MSNNRRPRPPLAPTPLPLSGDESRRARNLSQIATDRVAAALTLQITPSRVIDWCAGREPITPEGAMFIEEGLRLPPGALDRHSLDDYTLSTEPVVPATANVLPDPLTLPAKPVMDMAAGIRLNNLDRIGGVARGVRAALCRQIGKSNNMFSLLRSGALKFTPGLARNFEVICGLPEGWMDLPGAELPSSLAPWLEEMRAPSSAPIKGKVQPPTIERLATNENQHPRPVLASPPPLTSAPLATALAGVLHQKISEGAVSERMALRLLNILMDGDTESNV